MAVTASLSSHVMLNQHLLEHHGFTVDHTKTVLYGVCADCAGTQEKH